MAVGTVFVHNNSQAVYLPRDVSLPKSVHQAEIRANGDELVIYPLAEFMARFFCRRVTRQC